MVVRAALGPALPALLLLLGLAAGRAGAERPWRPGAREFLARQQGGGPAPPLLNSVFISSGSKLVFELDQQGWLDELALMQSVGVDNIVVKSACHVSPRPGSPSDFPGLCIYDSALPWLRNKGVDAVGRLLEAADRTNVTVHLGHFEYGPGWFNRTAGHKGHSLEFVQDLTNRTMLVLQELHARYGDHASWVGVYDPQEPNGRSWPRAGGDPREKDWLIDGYWGTVMGWARDRGFVNSNAPFFHNSSVPAEQAAWWDDALARAPWLDLFILDDDQASNFWTIEGVIPFFEAMRPVCAKYGVALWSDAVNHQHPSVDPQGHPHADPQPIAHFVKQLEAEAPYVSGFTTVSRPPARRCPAPALTRPQFEWFQYMSPTAGAKQAALFADYKAYYDARPRR